MQRRLSGLVLCLMLAFANEIFQMGEDDDGDGRVEEHERLRWDDEHQDGAAFKEWEPFDHPQLGPVEIGGWRKFGQNNPFADRLQEEVNRNVEFVLVQARNVPRLEIAELQVTPLGGDVHRVEAKIANAGFSPTELAIRVSQDRAVAVRAEVGGEGVEVLSSEARVDLGTIRGHGEIEQEWIVRGGRERRFASRPGIQRPGGRRPASPRDRSVASHVRQMAPKSRRVHSR